MRPALLLLLLLTSLPALACRCKPLPLSSYYAQANSVQIGRLVSSQAAGVERVLQFASITAYKPLEWNANATQAYRTGISTAACGVPAQPGATYVLFARPSTDDPGPPHIDSCNGSRLIISADGQPGTDFINTPLRFLPRQLHGLAGLDALKAISWPRPGDPQNSVVIGLLDLKTLPHGGPAILYAEPRKSAAQAGMVADWADVDFRESGYEVPAAVVFAESGGWYRLRLADGRFGWLAPEQAGTYFPYAELIPNRLNYLTAAWNGLVWPEPGASLPFRHRPTADAASRGEHPARVLDAQRVADSLWFRVEILDGDECSQRTPQTVLSGWVPAYGDGGQPTAWYYARGC